MNNLLFLIALVAAFAEPQTDDATKLRDKIAATEGVQMFGRCASKLADKHARNILRYEPGSIEEYRLTSVFLDKTMGCLENKYLPRTFQFITFLTFDRLTLRGAIAEGLVMARGYNGSLSPNESAIFRPHVFMKVGQVDAKNRLINTTLLGLTDCVVAAAPDRVWPLLQATAMSSEEKRHFKDLTPVLANCLPVGDTVSLDHRRLRAGLAESFYVALVGRQSSWNSTLGDVRKEGINA